MIKKTGYQMLLALAGIILSLPAAADLVPTGNNTFYYRMGGGQSAAVPAYNGAVSVPLQVDSDVGLGYNCGIFNPKLSIIDSLNNIENSFQNIEQTVINNATAAITEFPMYLIARADPSLYNLLNNGLLGARRDLELSTKNCQAMQNEISKGQNPYANWATLSMGNDWKYQMSLAGQNNNKQLAASDPNTSSSDINLVNTKIQQDNGTNGVPWVQGANIGRSSLYAGGQNQPAIYVIHDTAVAGYNVILQAGRNYNDVSAPARTSANAHSVDTWANPQLAANWINNVLGEEKITTFSGGNKQTTPGVGLLSDDQQLANQINQQLQSLVSGQTSITLANLQAVSAPGVMINTAAINAIRQQTPVSQAIVVNKLAQEAATAQLIDMALLARQMLQEGSQVPAIYGNQAAQESLKRAMNRLNQEIDNLLFNVHVRKELVSDTVTQLLNQTQSQQTSRTLIQPNKLPAPMMTQGAVQQSSKGE